MPFIQVKSLPFEEAFNASKAVEAITRDFATDNSIPIIHVHTTWEFYQSGCYAKGEDAPSFQPNFNHPIIVDLLTPDFNKIVIIEVMLTSLAKSIVTHSNTNLKPQFWQLNSIVRCR